MPKKKMELTDKMRDNVKKVIETVCRENGHISQNELADLIGYGPEQITRIKNGQRGMSPGVADAIIQAFPDKNYQEDWLRGLTPYRTAGDAFAAELTSATKPARDHQAIIDDVADMMRYCGVEWDGKPVQLVQSDDGLRPVNVKPVNVQGVELYPWDLSMIADKVFEYLKMELHFAVMAKENEKIRSKASVHQNGLEKGK